MLDPSVKGSVPPRLSGNNSTPQSRPVPAQGFVIVDERQPIGAAIRAEPGVYRLELIALDDGSHHDPTEQAAKRHMVLIRAFGPR